MVFEKFETWNFQSPGPEEVFSSSWNFWGQRGYQLQSTGPTSFRGRSFQSKLGIHRVVEITVVPSGSAATVQIHFRADVRSDVAAGGVVVAVLLLPVAVVGAAVSWHEYERDWSQERWDYWNSLTTGTHAQPAPGSTPPPPPSSPLLGPTSPPPANPPPPPPPSSTSPAAAPAPPAAPPAPVVCPSCGKAVTGEGKFCASCGQAIPGPG